MKVLKFGGTSVGTIDSLRNVKRIVEAIDSPAIIVVSALGGLTDRLIQTAKRAAGGDSQAVADAMANFRQRHFDIIDALVPEERRQTVRETVAALLAELERIYTGLTLIADLPDKTLCLVESFGERMSSVIVANMLADATHRHSPDFIKTEKWFNRNIADRALTERLIREEFDGNLDRHAVTGGFISTDKNTGEITNLGRGGSDYTAALIAAALGADSLEIWTDVDGFLTADPRIIPEASVIPQMSFIESMELCSFGAKVIYPPTIYPVFHKNIPIRILNTFHPEAPGTFISDSLKATGVVRGISSIGSTALITIGGPLTANVAEVNSRAYNAMARNGIGILLVTQPTTEADFSLVLPADDADRAREILSMEFKKETTEGSLEPIGIVKDLSVIAVVGESIKNVAGLAPRLVNTLQRNAIEVPALSDGASETTIAIVVNNRDLLPSLRLIHSACFPAADA